MTDQKLRWTKVDLGLRSPNWVTPLGYSARAIDGTATHVCRWYNADERSWVVSLSDEQGHQIGNSSYVYSRDDAEAEARFLIATSVPEVYPDDDDDDDSPTIEGVDPGPTDRQCYWIVAEELDVPAAQRAEALDSLDERIVDRARDYAKRAHKRWPPRPAETGWRVSTF